MNRYLFLLLPAVLAGLMTAQAVTPEEGRQIYMEAKAARQGHRTAERSLRLIPKMAPLPVDPSINQATRQKKGLELYEHLYKLKDYRPARENRNSSTTINGKTTYQNFQSRGPNPIFPK